jgi:signal transduction histidine kinase
MRLAEFIRANTKTIIGEWEAFARTCLPAAEAMSTLALRDHAKKILKAIADDMDSSQNATEQIDKSKGHSQKPASRLNRIGQIHGMERAEAGFSLIQVTAEYRALRASVVRLWKESLPAATPVDITELTRFNEAIDQALFESITRYAAEVEHYKDRFIAILSHDLRSPIGAILASAGVMARSENLGGSEAKAISMIVNSATDMNRMITDLTEFARTRLGIGIPIVPAPTDMGSICRQVADVFQALHPDRILHFEATGDLQGEWDAARLKQVVSNLIGNAVQHGAPKSPITVRVRRETEKVVLTVHNEGTPIPRNALQTIFDPLARATPEKLETRADSTSLGLGLYIARTIVIAHGGTIAVTSSGPEGTTFTVRLPQHSHARG